MTTVAGSRVPHFCVSYANVAIIFLWYKYPIVINIVYPMFPGSRTRKLMVKYYDMPDIKSTERLLPLLPRVVPISKLWILAASRVLGCCLVVL